MNLWSNANQKESGSNNLQKFSNSKVVRGLGQGNSYYWDFKWASIIIIYVGYEGKYTPGNTNEKTLTFESSGIKIGEVSNHRTQSDNNKICNGNYVDIGQILYQNDANSNYSHYAASFRAQQQHQALGAGSTNYEIRSESPIYTNT